MKVSLPGVLERAAWACERSPASRHLGYSLRMLLRDLRELRDDPTRLDEFFAAWVDDATPAAAAPPPVTPSGS
jgi:hypothetical protein